jgi:hypothetical protein
LELIVDREAFLNGLGPALANHEQRPGVKFSAGLGMMFANQLLKQGCPKEEVAMLIIFSDILRHLGNQTDNLQ